MPQTPNAMEKITQLDQSLQTLHRYARQIRHDFANRTGLNYTEFELLAVLNEYDRPMSVKEVSKELFLCSQAVTKISKFLLSVNLIVVEKSKEDKRVTFLSLTDSGRSIAAREQNARESVLQKCLVAIPSQHIDNMNQVMMIVRQSASHVVENVVAPQLLSLPRIDNGDGFGSEAQNGRPVFEAATNFA
jgi:DNA-binding MarR family transcriptional regulator